MWRIGIGKIGCVFGGGLDRIGGCSIGWITGGKERTGWIGGWGCGFGSLG